MNFHICKRLISHHSQLPKSHISCRLFLVFYSSSTEKPSPVFDLLRRHNFSSQIASKVASELSHLKDAEHCDSVLSFFKESGFSVPHLEKLATSGPKVLAASVDKIIKPQVKIFQDLGFSSTDIADFLSADPCILFRSAVNGVESSLRVLGKLLGSSSEVARLLKIFPFFLKYDLERTLLPNVELLKGCGISTYRIVRQLYCFPRFFLRKPENIKKFIQKVDELGCNRNSKMYLHAIRTVSSMNEKNWELKVEHFRKLGFSEEEILSMFHRWPQVFALSNRKLKNAVQLILDKGKYELSYISDHADILIFSVEKRVKPRLQVIATLQSRNLIKGRPSLPSIFKYSNMKFFQKYVSPYLDEVSEFAIEGPWTNEIHNFHGKDLGKQNETFVL